MTPSVKQEIQAIIVGGGNSLQCNSNCGLDWSLAENIRQAKEEIKARFGDRVRLKYLDLSEGRNLELQRSVSSQGLPLLLINQEPRISGQFDLRMLLDAIQAEIEIRQQ